MRQSKRTVGEAIERVVGIMARLRAEGGCPWDREQDLRSLRPYLVEETYEVLDEMDRICQGGPWAPLCEELGDLLYQIVFHAQLATEIQEFSMADVCEAISDKIESRHPHVFGEVKVRDAEEVLDNWAELKAKERKKKHGREGSVLDGVPTGAPALLRAERLTEKASRIGFDWPDLAGVRGKLQEELEELDRAIASGSREERDHELGDVLFSLANLARFIQAPAEDALRGAIARFTSRFHEIEAGLAEQGVPFGKATLEQMDALWLKAKQREKALPRALHTPRATLQGLELPVGDVEAQARFWDAVAPLLGWERWRAPRGSAPADQLEYQGGGVRCRFFQGAAGEGRGLRITVEAPSASAVEALAQRLRELGEGAVEGTPDVGVGTLTFVDPNGLRWQYRSPSNATGN